MTYHDYLKDKRVIFVGPAPNLLNTNKGDWIDSFDVVIRTNNWFYMIEEYPEYEYDYGTRCEVLYTNAQFAREADPFPLEDWKSQGLKYLNMKKVTHGGYCKTVSTRPVGTLSAPLVAQGIKSPLMGAMLVYDSLQGHPKEFWLAGMDFYLSKPEVFIPNDWREYLPGYLPKKVQTWANVNNIGKKDRHDPSQNTQFFYNLWSKGDIMLSEETLNALMLWKKNNGS